MTGPIPTGERPRGVLLLSPPGCGKSQFCKALGNEVGRPVLVLPGNHDVKLLRHLRGRNVTLTHGLQDTVDQLAREPEELKAHLVRFLDSHVGRRRWALAVTADHDVLAIVRAVHVDGREVGRRDGRRQAGHHFPGLM